MRGRGAADTNSASVAVAVVRYVEVSGEPGVVEMAAIVADDWQGQGLGRALLELAGPARRITCANEKQKPNGDVSLSQRWDRMMERLARC
jgi:GNAT superfamily N-acetyltransferase